MTVDVLSLRKSHVEGWKPRQSVEIDVLTLEALLDELELARAKLARVESVIDMLRGVEFMEAIDDVLAHALRDEP